ncbi:MAG: TetR/AcrR family transcriptional regulator [Pseudomonadota bacterium]
MSDKKRQRRKDARPEEIVSAALEEFASKGYAGTSMGSIAVRAGIARSTIYLYFEDKEAVIEAAFKDRVETAIRTSMEHASLVEGPFDEVLRTMLTGVLNRFLEPDRLILFKVLITEGQQFPSLLERYHATTMANAKQLLSNLLAIGVRRGELRKEALDYDHRLIIAPIIVTAMWQLTFETIDPIDRDKFIAQYVDLLSRALR